MRLPFGHSRANCKDCGRLSSLAGPQLTLFLLSNPFEFKWWVVSPWFCLAFLLRAKHYAACVCCLCLAAMGNPGVIFLWIADINFTREIEWRDFSEAVFCNGLVFPVNFLSLLIFGNLRSRCRYGCGAVAKFSKWRWLLKTFAIVLNYHSSRVGSARLDYVYMVQCAQFL